MNIIGKDVMSARQGDIFIERVDAVPEGCVEVERDSIGRVVLARGELHDHTHAIRDRGVCSLRATSSDEVDYFTVSEAGATLTHEYSSGAQADHDPVGLAPGAYRVTRQREYVAPQIERRVVD